MKTPSRLLLASLLILVATPPMFADFRQASTTFSSPLRYWLYTPEAEAPADGWPLVVFLHGAGERGDDLQKVTVHGPPKFAAAGGELPYILVAPQCPTGIGWEPLGYPLWQLVDELLAAHPINPDRIYLTGLSMGGYGTFGIGALAPERLAAIAPICGGAEARIARTLADVPAWVVHGALDMAVPVGESVKAVRALREAGGDPRFTIYPYAGHDTWTRTYGDPAFWEWLLAQRRGQPDPLAEAWRKQQAEQFGSVDE